MVQTQMKQRWLFTQVMRDCERVPVPLYLEPKGVHARVPDMLPTKSVLHARCGAWTRQRAAT